jgi:hypothetical protein
MWGPHPKLPAAKALPERCFVIYRKLRNLAKDAHRGRHGTSCPAMPPLRFVGACIAPTPLWKRGALHPNFEKASQEKGRLRRSTAKTRVPLSLKSLCPCALRASACKPFRALRMWKCENLTNTNYPCGEAAHGSGPATVGCRGGVSPCKSANPSSRGTKCHCVRDERICKIAELAENSEAPSWQSCGEAAFCLRRIPTFSHFFTTKSTK